LLKAIVDIATFGGKTYDRRRSETIRAVKTLDELITKLNARDYQVGLKIRRLKIKYAVIIIEMFFVLYSAKCRLLATYSLHIKYNRKHITTVTIRLAKAAKNLQKPHSDTMFLQISNQRLGNLCFYTMSEGHGYNKIWLTALIINMCIYDVERTSVTFGMDFIIGPFAYCKNHCK
jgi:hypothetical protein